MFPYTSTQLISMHPHQHQQQHHHQQPPQPTPQPPPMYSQPQQPSIVFYPYNQLQSIQPTYPTPGLTSIRYIQQPREPQKQKYRSDQIVPRTSPPITSPIQQQIQRSSPINMVPLSSPNMWMNNTTLQNPALFRPIIRTISNAKMDDKSHNNTINNTGTVTPALPAAMSFESPKLCRHHQHHSKRQSSNDNHQQRQRQRLHSGSSCYGSDSPMSSDNEDPSETRTANPKTVTLISLTAKKRRHSIGRTELTKVKHLTKDTHIPSLSINSNGFGTNNTVISTTTTHSSSTKTTPSVASRPKLLQYIEENVIGKDYIFQGPWGLRRMIYCDYTASGRPLHFIENYIKNSVLPLYGNTHSETSLCAQQSTKFREEARLIIKKSVNANDDDVLLFTGTGSTGAVHTLVVNFELHDETVRKNTVVIISTFEHHSNILPWKETGVEMIRIPTTQQGILDKAVFEERLQHYSKLNKRIICSLNAASNISGILTDVDAISTLVHEHSGFVLWDYATAAPYVKIDMNASSTAYKDAIFISTHKFIGGPGTPGLLIAKKRLFSLKAPKACGGGTVNFVTRTCHEYNHNIETREEGGTPDIVGCIRAGLVFQLKDAIDINYLQTREDELCKRFYRRFKKNDTLILLGSQTAPRIPIFSFLIYVPGVCKYLHHNFVCLLLNDLFGIQVRSGCACAGPYALDLLNIDNAKTDIYCKFMTEDACARGDDHIVRTVMMKPGFTRLNLSFFANDYEIEYILHAVQFVATEGWKFLPLYTYNPVTAGWSHRSGFALAQSSLRDITYKAGKMQYFGSKKHTLPARGEKMDPFREAKLMAADAVRRAFNAIDYTSDPPLNVPDNYKHMIWFTLPIDIALMMSKQKEAGEDLNANINSIPFMPEEAKEKLINSPKTSELSNNLVEPRKKHNSVRSLQLNFYTSVGQFREEIAVNNGSLRRYFSDQEYHSIIPGTIDFPGQRILEQDLYNSNEDLRNMEIYVRSTQCDDEEATKARLIDPYSLLIKYDSSRYTYVSRDQIEFNQDPNMNGMVLSVRLDNKTSTKTNMTYLSRGLWWTPRYEIVVDDKHLATLRALADLTNEHEHSYTIENSQLITGSVPLVSTSLRVPSPMDSQRIEFMATPLADSPTPISSKPDATSFGTYSYNLTSKFTLLPKSIKTFPFLTTTITLNYTLEATTYLSVGTTSGQFQRMFIIQPADFLPAGTITFYLASTGLTLGQNRLPDTAKQTQQSLNLGGDPDVKFQIISVMTAIRQTPTYGQDLNVNVTISNRKEKQTVSVILTLNSGYRNTTSTLRYQSSSNITITQDPNNKSVLIIHATIQPNEEETCVFTVIQIN
ncbi:unnamed protein product [Adineta ricciae]|uniref:Aminotransferase class V domain-containing protein n=2 Tax=Adineta ricciae TaxID=249248 RepID=A0A815EB33_ADIRI|nr:unnamed protein product [Adineta ricciae]